MAARARTLAALRTALAACLATLAAVALGCGQAAPFILEVGISSTLRIAEFWALTPAQPAEAAAPEWNGRQKPQPSGKPGSTIVIDQDGRVLDDTPRAEPADDGKNRGTSRLDPGSVITKALRAAGLMK